MELLHQIVDAIVAFVGQWGYLGIFIMMLLESTFFPFPSEVVMIPAGYLAFKGEMSLFVVIFMGIAGSLVGSLINYFLAHFLGQKFLLKYGKYFFVSSETLQKMEKFFAKHGHISVFTARLIPGVRQYISLPAGMAKMKMSSFCLYTVMGAGIWVIILALVGYFLGQSQELVSAFMHELIFWIIVLVIAVVVVYIGLHKRANKRKK